VLLSSWISLELVQLSVHLPGRCISIIKNSLKDWGQVRDVRPRDASSRSELNVLSIPTCAFRHERRVVVRHSFLREEKRFNRISPTQKTTATLTSRESFSPTYTHTHTHTHTYTHTHSQIFLLPTTISYNTEKCFQRERWIETDRSYFTTVILLRKKRWSARNKLSKTAWKMRSHIGIIRDSTWNHLEQFAFSQCVSWDLNV